MASPSTRIAQSRTDGGGTGTRAVSRAAHDMASGTVVAFLSFAYSLSFALVLFSGPLVASAPHGMAVLLLSAGLSTLIVAALGSFRLAVAGPDTAVIAVLAAMLAGLAARAPAGTSAAQLELLAFVALAGTTLFVGALLLLFGVLRLGIWIRYVPYPVVSGFLTASGVLLVLGAVRLVLGELPRLGALPDLTQPKVALPLALTAAVAALLVVARVVWNRPMLLPVLLFVAIAAVDGGLALLEISRDQALALGLLMQPVKGDGVGLPWNTLLSIPVDAGLLLNHASEVAVITGVTAIAILLNATGIEVSEHTQMNLDRELRVNGLANLLVGACGGVVSNLSLNRSRANRLCGATSRLSGVIAGCLCLASIVVGPRVVAWVPTPVVAGLLIFMGAQLIWTWLVKPLRRRGPSENAVAVAIPVLAVYSGYLEATALGVIASCTIFAVRYARIRVVKHDLTRREYTSSVERAPEHAAFLRNNGDLIHILWIQGYLFFGTANRLFESGRTRLHGTGGRPIRFLIVDLSNVTGIDSSSVFSFMKLADRVYEQGATMILCGLSASVRKAFGGTDFLRNHDRIMLFEQVAGALEWAEDRLLHTTDLNVPERQPFATWLAGELGGQRFADRMTGYMEVLDLDAGATLFRQEDPADSLFIVQSGRVSIVLQRPNADPIRLRAITGYTVVGEMGLYRSQTRAASVITDEPSKVCRLTRDAMARMERDDPDLSTAFHAFIVRVLADRLGFANTEIAALQR